MIVAHSSDRKLVLTTQTDHAAFSAELLSLWRSDGLPENPRRRPLLRATREHDNGWAETDSAPRTRPDGRPHDFTSLPSAERLELWRRGVDRWRDREPEVAVYVVRHALALHQDRPVPGDDGTDEGTELAARWHETLASWRRLEEELLEAAGWSTEDLDADYAFLARADLLSLAACARWTEPRTHASPAASSTGEMRFRLDAAARGGPRSGPAVLRLEPFPLAGATTFHVRARTIPDRRYESDADLALELASATWDTLDVRVAPWHDPA